MNYRKIVTVVLLAVGGLMTAMPEMVAAEEKLEVKASTTMKEVLSEWVGKRVTLRLNSGETLEGTVAMVGNSVVHLSKLAGKDFYDAVVNIDHISALLVQVRGR